MLELPENAVPLIEEACDILGRIEIAEEKLEATGLPPATDATRKDWQRLEAILDELEDMTEAFPPADAAQLIRDHAGRAPRKLELCNVLAELYRRQCYGELDLG